MENVARIPLTNGEFALVDADLFEELSAFTWSKSKSGYAYRQWWEAPAPGVRQVHKQEWMHVRINGTGAMTDHRNRCKLDNRRSNLRDADKSKNAANAKKLVRPRLTSAYKGVSRYTGRGSKLWRARIQIEGKEITAYFDTEEDAAFAYNELAIKYFGEFAKLNAVGV